MFAGLISLVLFNRVGLGLWFVVYCAVLRCSRLFVLYLCVIVYYFCLWVACSLVTLLIIVALLFASGYCLCWLIVVV